MVNWIRYAEIPVVVHPSDIVLAAGAARTYSLPARVVGAPAVSNPGHCGERSSGVDP